MSLANKDGWIWRNGEMIPWREATTHFLTHTLHYGLGVFEGVRAYKTEKGSYIFRLHEHTKRLLDSAKIVQMPIKWSADELNKAQKEILRKNNLESAYIRPMSFYNSEEMGIRTDKLTVQTMIAAWEWPSYMEPEAAEKGIRMKTSSYTRHHINSSMCRAKVNGHYVNSILALHEAVAAGADEALLLDQEGYVSEGSGENIFLVRDKTLYTPALTSCLEGITRASIITLAKELNIKLIEKNITRDEVYIADEIFLTGTAAEVIPVNEVDQRKIGSGERGDITKLLQEAYFKETHAKGNKHPEWLSPVDS